MKKVYNKLVRDNIPEIIRADGKKCNVKVLTEQKYTEELNKKLSEEIKEYLDSKEVEELADIEEIIRALLITKKVTLEDFEKIIESKKSKRGGFSKRLFLESVDEND